MTHMLRFLQPMVITDIGLMSNMLTASSHSHNRCMPFMVMCPNEVRGRHRILFYMVFQTPAVNQLGLVPCLFSALKYLYNTSRDFLPSVFWLGLLKGIHRSLESGTRVMLGYLFLEGLKQVGGISSLKDTTPISSSSIPETTHF